MRRQHRRHKVQLQVGSLHRSPQEVLCRSLPSGIRHPHRRRPRRGRHVPCTAFRQDILHRLSRRRQARHGRSGQEPHSRCPRARRRDRQLGSRPQRRMPQGCRPQDRLLQALQRRPDLHQCQPDSHRRRSGRAIPRRAQEGLHRPDRRARRGESRISQAHHRPCLRQVRRARRRVPRPHHLRRHRRQAVTALLPHHHLSGGHQRAHRPARALLPAPARREVQGR